jgi:tetratricopeptide (TPR) repeat protein
MHPYRNKQSICIMREYVLAACLILLAPLGCSSLSPPSYDDMISLSKGGARASRVHQHKGVKLVDHGKLPAAAKAFERAITLNRNNGSAHNNLGLVYFQQRRFADAAAEFDIASQLLPEDPTPWNNLGMTMEATGRGLESLEFYSRAYELAPTNPVYLGNFVRTRIRLGEGDDTVIDQLKDLQFIETRPDWKDWIADQLAIQLNPMLDRGPPPPNLSNSSKKKAESDNKAELSDRDSGPSESSNHLIIPEPEVLEPEVIGEWMLVEPQPAPMPEIELEERVPQSRSILQ